MMGDRKAELGAVLLEWRGAGAQLWQYSASLAELHIRLKREGESGNVHLVCNGCTRIEAPTSWAASAIELAEEAGQQTSCVLKDARAGLLVKCGMIRVLRDVAPVY